jgi:hypothetical protein
MPPKPTIAFSKAPLTKPPKFNSRHFTEVDREDDSKGFKNIIKRNSMFGENTIGHKVLKHVVENSFEKNSYED